jgi:hypothetical protein
VVEGDAFILDVYTCFLGAARQPWIEKSGGNRVSSLTVAQTSATFVTCHSWLESDETLWHSIILSQPISGR